MNEEKDQDEGGPVKVRGHMPEDKTDCPLRIKGIVRRQNSIKCFSAIEAGCKNIF